MSGRAAALALLAAAAGAAAATGCGGPGAGPLPRVLAAAPAGPGARPSAAAWVRFSAPVDPDGLLDGRRLVLVEARDLRAAIAAVEAEGGAAGAGLPAAAALDEGGARAVLRPAAPLRPRTAHALVLSERIRAADGRPVLDPEGRRRTFVQTFETGAPEGPPPRPVLTEVRARAESPQAGGEYVEVANLGEGPLDLEGWRLVKRTASGAVASCAVLAPAGAAIPPGGLALLAGGAWDGRHPLPEEVPVLSCGASSLAGGLADDHPPALTLADPEGVAAATFGAGGGPLCAAAAERLDPEGPDRPENLGCSDGSPGWLEITTREAR